MEILTPEERRVFEQLQKLKEWMKDEHPTTLSPIHEIDMLILLGDQFPRFLCYIFQSNLTPLIHYLAARQRMTEYEFVVFIAQNYGTDKELIRSLKPYAFKGFVKSVLFRLKPDQYPWNAGVKKRS